MISGLPGLTCCHCDLTKEKRLKIEMDVIIHSMCFDRLKCYIVNSHIILRKLGARGNDCCFGDPGTNQGRRKIAENLHTDKLC